MIACLKYIEQNNLHSVIIYSDSTIIVNQTNATWRIKESSPLLSEGLRARELYTNLCFGEPERIIIKWIPREQNKAGFYFDS